MFLRLVYQSFHRQRRSKLLAGAAIALGAAVATAMVAVATGIGDQMNRDLRAGVGDSLRLGGSEFHISGILETGGAEEREIIAPLHVAQALAGHPGAVKSIYVSALTKPEDAFARRNPYSLSPADRDRWYCSPYANSIAFQLTEAIPHSQAEQIRRVAQREGQILSRVQGLMLLITLAALVAAALAVSAAMATALMERRREIGLMKALGASGGSVARVFHAEAAMLALLGGCMSFAQSMLLYWRVVEDICVID